MLKTQIITKSRPVNKRLTVSDALGEITVQFLSIVCVCVFYTEVIYTAQVCLIGQTPDTIRLKKEKKQEGTNILRNAALHHQFCC